MTSEFLIEWDGIKRVSLLLTMNTRYLRVLFLGVLVVAGIGYVLGVGTVRGPLFPENSGQTSGHKLVVTASFYPLYYFASVIGGDRADIQNLTPAGVEPHDFEPTSQDIARIEKGDLLVLNGGVEAWGDKVRGLLKGTKIQTVVAGEGLFTQGLIEEGKMVVDPHVWLSPPLAKKEVGRILNGFISGDPDNRTFYEANARNLESRLDQLDTEYRVELANCRQREIVTSHAAFEYLAKTYGLTQVAIAGLSPDTEPSVRDLAEVVKLAREKQIKYIFFESLVSPKLSETIADEVEAKTLVLDPLEGLTDEKKDSGKNYLTVMRDNLVNLRLALECR